MQESNDVKEHGNCFRHVQKKVLTGFSEIAKSKRCRRMTVKMFVFFLCTAGFLYQTWTFLQMYLAYPTTLDISEEYPDSFVAPAVTICNKNRLSRQPYCHLFPEKCTWEHTTWESFCNEYRRMCPQTKPPYYNFGIPDILRNLSPDRTLALLTAAGPYSQTIAPFVSTAMNSTFVTMIYQKNGQPYRCTSYLSLLINQNKETRNLTLADWYTVQFDMHPEEYFNTYELVEASVVVHDPRKAVNPMTEGITLTPGKIHQLFPTMERRESLPPPYASNCKDYLTDWEKNGRVGPLSKDDCINQCKIDANVKKFGCIGHTMTYGTHNRFPICRYNDYEILAEDHRICTTFCPEACEENIYHVTEDSIFDFTGECNETDEHCKNRFLFIQVNLNRMKIKKFKQIPRIESIELFSYIGGYLGMWLGISISSVFDLAEMLYDVIGYALLKRKRKMKKGNSD